MTHSVRLSPQARTDFVRLLDFLDVQNPMAAARLRETLAAATESLRQFPNRGRMSAQLGYRELTVPFGHTGYFLRYRVLGSMVLVIRIRHAREQR